MAAWRPVHTPLRLLLFSMIDPRFPTQNQIIVVPVVVLETFKREEPPWSAAGWRIACVCIGVGLDVAVCSLLFPVTTGALMWQRLLGALRQLASLAEGVAACQAGGRGARGEASAGAMADDGAAAKLEAGLHLEDGGAASAERRRLQALAQEVGEGGGAPSQSCTCGRGGCSSAVAATLTAAQRLVDWSPAHALRRPSPTSFRWLISAPMLWPARCPRAPPRTVATRRCCSCAACCSS